MSITRTKRKQAELEATASAVPSEISQALFLDILAAKAEAIIELAGIIPFYKMVLPEQNPPEVKERGSGEMLPIAGTKAEQLWQIAACPGCVLLR